MFGGSKPPKDVTPEFMKAFMDAKTTEDMDKLFADEDQMTALVAGLVDEQAVKAAAHLFEGCALHYTAVRDRDWALAERLARQISKRALELEMAAGCRVQEQQARQERQ